MVTIHNTTCYHNPEDNIFSTIGTSDLSCIPWFTVISDGDFSFHVAFFNSGQVILTR